jgi:hypothetical protein
MVFFSVHVFVWVYLGVFLWVYVILMFFRVFAYMVIRRRRDVLRRNGEGGVVKGKSVSHHHHRCSAWQWTELPRVYGDTGKMENDWATRAYGDQGWRKWTE